MELKITSLERTIAKKRETLTHATARLSEMADQVEVVRACAKVACAKFRGTIRCFRVDAINSTHTYACTYTSRVWCGRQVRGTLSKAAAEMAGRKEKVSELSSQIDERKGEPSTALGGRGGGVGEHGGPHATG